LARVRGIGSAADTREPAIVQARRAETLPGFRLAPPLHKKKRHPAKRRVSSLLGSLVEERLFRAASRSLSTPVFLTDRERH
jgi:hypothetical protein